MSSLFFFFFFFSKKYKTEIRSTAVVINAMKVNFSKTTCILNDDVCISGTNLQGPVVQSVVSLTSSLRVISLTVLADSIYNILIFFAEKM